MSAPFTRPTTVTRSTTVEHEGLVAVHHLTKAFGSAKVVNDVSFSVEQGHKLVIIGPSGAGKSTLLRCINFLERPDGGDVLFRGAVVGYKFDRKGGRSPMSDRELAPTRARIGMVFQNFNLFPHLSVLANVAIGPRRVLGKTKQEAEAQAVHQLDRVGLGSRTNAFPEELSGGQRQRVAIARALALQPEIMLFDEATSALDPELIGEVLGVMRKLAEDGMTMIIVTHEMHFAIDVADRVLVMEQGSIIEDAPPAVIFKAPQNPRTQQFLHAVLDR